MKNQKGFVQILIIAVAVLIVACGIFAFWFIKTHYQCLDCVGGPVFTPSPAIASDKQCAGKPDGTSCQYGMWVDEKGQVCGGQSCVGLGMGVCSAGKCEMGKSQTDETANWKTYTNGDLKYSLLYPYNWRLDTTGREGCGPVFYAPSGGWISICPAPGGNSLEAVAASLSSGGTVTSSNLTTLDGHTAIRQQYKWFEQNLEYNQIQVIAKEDKTSGTTLSSDLGALGVFLYITDKNQIASLVETFDQILSTFKFTD